MGKQQVTGKLRGNWSRGIYPLMTHNALQPSEHWTETMIVLLADTLLSAG